MSFTINNKLSYSDSFRFLSSSLDSLVKNLNKYDFKYLIQEFDNNILDLVEQKGFYPYAYTSDSEKFKEELPSSLDDRKISDKEYEHALLLANVFAKFRNNSL